MPPVINSDQCEQCGVCSDVCPQDVFKLKDEGPPDVAYPEECWYCGACVLDCPNGGIHLKLPLQMHIVPSPALFGSTDTLDKETLKKAAAFSRSVIED